MPFPPIREPRQSPGPQTACPRDPASGCCFILFGGFFFFFFFPFSRGCLGFDRSGSSRVLDEVFSEGGLLRLVQDNKAQSFNVFTDTCGKCRILGRREGPFMPSQFHQADRNTVVPVFMQLCPLIELQTCSTPLAHSRSHRGRKGCNTERTSFC